MSHKAAAPVVSVIITTYRRPYLLRRAIRSVLHQSYSDIELLVIDDNNADDHHRYATSRIISDFSGVGNIRYIKHEKNSNGAAARNTGLNLASGKYVTFLDDDDFFLPRRIENLVNYLESDRDLDGVYSGYAWQRKNKVFRIVYPSSFEDPVFELLRLNSFTGTGSNFICRTGLAREINGFDERFERFQDMEFLIRFAARFSIAGIQDISVVKCIDSTINAPGAAQLQGLTRLFLDKFASIIERYPSRKQCVIYQEHYRRLQRLAEGTRFRLSDAAQENVRRYGGLTFTDRLIVEVKKSPVGVYLANNIRYYFKSMMVSYAHQSLVDCIDNTMRKIALESNRSR